MVDQNPQDPLSVKMLGSGVGCRCTSCVYRCFSVSLFKDKEQRPGSDILHFEPFSINAVNNPVWISPDSGFSCGVCSRIRSLALFLIVLQRLAVGPEIKAPVGGFCKYLPLCETIGYCSLSNVTQM